MVYSLLLQLPCKGREISKTRDQMSMIIKFDDKNFGI